MVTGQVNFYKAFIGTINVNDGSIDSGFLI